MISLKGLVLLADNFNLAAKGIKKTQTETHTATAFKHV